MKNINISRSQNYFSKKNKFLLTGLAFLSGLTCFAQSNVPKEADSISLFSNPLFDTLLAIIILLLIIICVLGGALTSVAETVKNSTAPKNNNGKILSAILLIALLCSGKTTFAQDLFSISSSSKFGYSGLSSSVFYLLIAVIVFELIIILALINYIKLLAKTDRIEIIAVKKEQPSLLERLNASVAIEKEEDILLDHNYDGIRELDNDLPPWWKYGFYMTIIFAFIYLVHYHVTQTGDLQIAEYNKSILAAQVEKAEFEKNNANNVNESNVTMLTDKTEISKGETIFKENCFACHGKFGEGGVGPNLTDNYWLHGGTIHDIFKTIKYGWPDKGMKSWQADLSPVQIHEVASYIKTINGSNPPNGKAPQGDLYVESTISKDSLKKDSVQISLQKVDTAKTEHN